MALLKNCRNLKCTEVQSLRHASRFKNLFSGKKSTEEDQEVTDDIKDVKVRMDSVEAKGKTRTKHGYQPADDVVEQVRQIYNEEIGATEQRPTFPDSHTKFKLLTRCERHFDHGIPDSILHTINSLEKLTEFYMKPVEPITSLEQFAKQDLPPNLHVNVNYKRYNPEVDGPTAFPKSSTFIHSLKGKKLRLKGNQQSRDPNYLKYPEEQWRRIS